MSKNSQKGMNLKRTCEPFTITLETKYMAFYDSSYIIVDDAKTIKP